MGNFHDNQYLVAHMYSREPGTVLGHESYTEAVEEVGRPERRIVDRHYFDYIGCRRVAETRIEGTADLGVERNKVAGVGCIGTEVLGGHTADLEDMADTEPDHPVRTTEVELGPMPAGREQA